MQLFYIIVECCFRVKQPNYVVGVHENTQTLRRTVGNTQRRISRLHHKYIGTEEVLNFYSFVGMLNGFYSYKQFSNTIELLT